jgi:hypothetical protein
MGHILIEQRDEIMAILANYIIGSELDWTIRDLVELGISIQDLSLLKRIFKDVNLTCTRLEITSPYTYDFFCYEFTPEEIAAEVTITNKLIWKILFSPYYLFYKGIFKNDWLSLQSKLECALSQNRPD